jgi:hypothetical protein
MPSANYWKSAVWSIVFCFFSYFCRSLSLRRSSSFFYLNFCLLIYCFL